MRCIAHTGASQETYKIKFGHRQFANCNIIYVQILLSTNTKTPRYGLHCQIKLSKYLLILIISFDKGFDVLLYMYIFVQKKPPVVLVQYKEKKKILLLKITNIFL